MKPLRAFLLPLFVANACAAVPAAAPIAGKHYVAEGLGDVDAQQRPRLEFVADGRLAGYTGCNVVSGRWRLEGAEVKLEGLIATKRGCIGPGSALERQFLAAVSEKSHVALEGGKLVAQGIGGRMVFVQSPHAQ